MKTLCGFAVVVTIVFAMTVSSLPAMLITGGFGNAPMKDRGWPRGVLEVANHKARIAWWEGPPFGGGEWHFLYRGKTDKLNAMLKDFSAIASTGVELHVHAGKHESFWLKGKKGFKDNATVDWTFTVWIPRNWHHLFNNPKSFFASDQANFRQPVPAPRIDVYLGQDLEWSDVDVPPGVRVIDERITSVPGYMGPGSVVLARFFDIETGKPVIGARLVVRNQGGEAYESTAASNDDGVAQVGRIPIGVYSMSCEAEGYAPRQLAYEQFEADTARRLTVYLAKTSQISGQILSTDGSPLPGVKVRLANAIGIDGRGYPLPTALTVETDEQGKFSLIGAPQGFAQLRCQSTAYYHNGLFEIHDVPSENIAIRMVRTNTIHVTVRDQEGHPPQQNYIVQLEPEGDPIGKWGGSATLKPEGKYTFTGVPPGRYKVTAHPNPSRSTDPHPSQWIELGGGDSVDVTLEIKSRGPSRGNPSPPL